MRVGVRGNLDSPCSVPLPSSGAGISATEEPTAGRLVWGAAAAANPQAFAELEALLPTRESLAEDQALVFVDVADGSKNESDFR